jgi:hypothetical protein
MILDSGMEAGDRGSLCLRPAPNSLNYLCSRFYRLVFGNFGLRGLLAALPMRYPPVYHGLRSREQKVAF